MELEIEKAKIKDLDEILELFENTIKNSSAKDYNDAQISVWTSSIEDKEKWIHKIKNQYFIVVKTKNRIIGFGSLDKGYIDLLYVSSHFLRMGIASLVYQKLKIISEELGSKKLLTDASKTAVPFFESKGFTVIKENKIIRKGVEIINFEMLES
jgi:putative acetyltransferase